VRERWELFVLLEAVLVVLKRAVEILGVHQGIILLDGLVKFLRVADSSAHLLMLEQIYCGARREMVFP
jgi:hypothetical protein